MMKQAALAALVLALGVPGGAGAQEPAGRTRHPDAQWFGGAGLGLFLHWGLSSVDGRIDLSWGMMAGTPWDKGAFKLTPEQYFALAERFKPDKYDPSLWLGAAKKAGFRYAVLTTRHHDGFALWPSAFGEFSTKNHLGGRDLVKPYVEACRKAGLKAGLYYSPPDWYYNRHRMSFRYKAQGDAGPDWGLRHEPVTLPVPSAEDRRKWDEGFHAYVKGQVEELLTRYGKIDLLWFDGGPAAIAVERIRELQPGIVLNPRMHGKGDFETPEVHFPKERPKGWWELCGIWNSGGWGYTAKENYRSTASVLAEFVKVRAWSGNYLINMGPRPNGELPEVAYQRLAEFGEWMGHSGAAVMDVTPAPETVSANVPVTCRDKTWFLHALPGMKDPIRVNGAPRPAEAKLLRTGTPAAVRAEGDAWTVEIPAAQRTALVDVVSVRY
jgi:alpha-L-fucosidase